MNFSKQAESNSTRQIQEYEVVDYRPIAVRVFAFMDACFWRLLDR